MASYDVLVGAASSFPKSKLSRRQPESRFKRVAVKKIPSAWQEDFKELARNKALGTSSHLFPGTTLAGYINYQVYEGNRAINLSYYPKRAFESLLETEQSRPARGLGYYLETICVNHLKSRGVEQVATGPIITNARVNQLDNVGIPIRRFLPIGKWITRLGRGIKAGITR